MYKLAPSILSADFGNLSKQIQLVEAAGAEYIHIDVMDGIFVPSISFGVPIIKAIRRESKAIFDIHLMIEEPIRYIEEFIQAGADIITIHAEACKHLHRTICKIKELGAKVGIALNPATPLSVLDYVIEEIDMVLIMSVNPGFGGQKMISSSVQKVKDLKKRLEGQKKNIDIQVDGGIDKETIIPMIEAGASIFVVGTAIFSGKIEENIVMFKEVFQNASNKQEN